MGPHRRCKSHGCDGHRLLVLVPLGLLLGCLSLQGAVRRFDPSFCGDQDLEGPHGTEGQVLCLDCSTREDPHGGYSPICPVSRTHPETIAHLCHDCSFMIEAWNLIQHWSNDDSPAPSSSPSTHAYWESLIHGKLLAERNRLLYVWWGVWKERNRRVFRSATLPALEVAHLIWEDIRGRIRACSADPGD